jgi:hypothetical protein
MRTTPLLFASALVLVSVSTLRDAEACGGCFHEPPPPPTEADASTTQSASVVTDHRMALAITSQGTTLWDQIEYAGDPGKFVWVLPIQGAVVVSTGSDAFLDAIDQRTSPQIIGPSVYCNPPPPPANNGGGGGGFTGGSESSTFGCGCGASAKEDMAASGTYADAGMSADQDGGLALEPDEGVVVTHRDTVGPYETVQITGDGSESILVWLRKNGYEVPKSVEPMLQKYVDEKFGFLAVKLAPNAGVQAMKPIRVSWKGKTPQLPLRMVAAGVGVSVGLKLFVIGDGRWRTQNFETFTISPSSLTWDFEKSRSNYSDKRASKADAFDGRAWALESSIDVASGELPATDPVDPVLDGGAESSETAADTAAEDAPTDGAADADAEVEVDAGDLPPIDPSANDVTVAFVDGTRRITRLRADLPTRYLDVDLLLEADTDQSVLPADYHVTSAVHAEQLCTYGVAYTVPKSLSAAAESPEAVSAPKAAACAVGDEQRPFSVSLLGLGALAVLGLVRRVKR